MTIVYALLMFCLLIFVHELGHFMTAKAVGVRVNEFALGMGPAIFKKQKGETLYSLRAFPIGGYCAMEGEDEESDDDKAFNKKPAWAKALVVVAGSAMNVVLAIVILSLVILVNGMPTATIDKVAEGSPAYSAGILTGDEITAVDGRKVESWTEVTAAISGSTAEAVKIQIKRDGQVMEITTELMTGEDGRRVIGITSALGRNPVAAVGNGAKAAWGMTVSMVDVIGQLFTGDVPMTELTGPVGIVYAVGDTVKYGLGYLGYLAALISLNLAIVNMLPLPALDGGRLLFIIIRKITGRAITDQMEAKIHFAGILLLLGLMVYVTWNDIVRFIVPIFGG